MADEPPPMHFDDIIAKTGDAAQTLPPLTMPIEQAMRTQRALRRLKPDPVDEALVLRLIELALKAPTGRNAQNWEFVLVKDYMVKARLARLYRIAWSVYGRIGRHLTATNPKMLCLVDAVQWQVEHFEEIPVLVVACLRGLRPVWPPLVVTSYYGSIYPSVQNLLLAARAAGLGAALITLPLWSTWLVRRELHLPWRVTPCAVVPLGWPMGRHRPTSRHPVGDVVHLNRYGDQPFKTPHPSRGDAT
jgi:nitroreductase